jgi:hypothetical protein
MKIKTLISFIIILASFNLHAETVWEYVDRKLEKKKFKRWSLSSWLYKRQKMALQDQWLAMNIEEDYILTEFYIDYAKGRFDSDTADNNNEQVEGVTSEAGLFWGIIGLTGRYENYEEVYNQKEAALNLRLIGSSEQSTKLTATYGIREFYGNDTEDFTQTFYGGDISLYLVSFFGFDARYRLYNEQENEQKTHLMKSNRAQWGAFIDISFLRIFAYQFEENLEFTQISNSNTTELQIKGTAAGVRLYF